MLTRLRDRRRSLSSFCRPQHKNPCEVKGRAFLVSSDEVFLHRERGTVLLAPLPLATEAWCRNVHPERLSTSLDFDLCRWGTSELSSWVISGAIKPVGVHFWDHIAACGDRLWVYSRKTMFVAKLHNSKTVDEKFLVLSYGFVATYPSPLLYILSISQSVSHSSFNLFIR